jgi:hypothetical protein
MFSNRLRSEAMFRNKFSRGNEEVVKDIKMFIKIVDASKVRV